jgi:hypothetical protein
MFKCALFIEPERLKKDIFDYLIVLKKFILIKKKINKGRFVPFIFYDPIIIIIKKFKKRALGE